MSHPQQPTMPALFSRRTMFTLFAPLVVLVAAAVVVNAGGVARDAKAAPIEVEATVTSATWTENSSCGAAFTGPDIQGNQNATLTPSCTITFGRTNATSNLSVGADANFWTQGGGFYSNYAGTVCDGQLPAQSIGFKIVSAAADTTIEGAGCVAEPAATNGANSEWRPIPRGTSTLICTATTIGTKTCEIGLGIRGHGTNPVIADTYTGELTLTGS